MDKKIKRKKILGFFLFVLSFFSILLNSIQITGNAISYENSFSIISIISLIFMFFSLLLLTSKKSLEAIVVPTSGKSDVDKERAKTAREHYSNENQYFILSGGRSDRPLTDSERADIYRELRKVKFPKKYGRSEKIKVSQMTLEGSSRDSVENVLYSLEKLRPGTKKVTFVSYPLHLKRFEMIFDKAKEEGLIPEKIEAEYIPTSQNMQEIIYGTLALIKEKLRLRKGIKEAQNKKTGRFGNLVKMVLENK